MSVETLKIYECNAHACEKKEKVSFGKLIVGGLRNLFDLLYRWNERQRSLYHLSQLDDRMLKDVGLSRADVEGELQKSFWVK